MNRRRFLSQTAAAAVVAGSYSPMRLGAQEPPVKVALLVGVNRYDKRIFIDKPLEYAERDVSEMATELRTQGFAVRLLLGSSTGGDRATKANFDRALQEVLAGRNARDLVLVGFAGHGQQMPLLDAQGREQKGPDGKALEDAFFCPADAVLGEVATLVSLTGLMETLNRKGGVNLVLVDACRDNPDPSRGQRSITGNELNGRLPVNTAIMFSCAAGQQAWETKDAGGGHGVFFYHVLEGLRGEAAKRNGDVTWGSLVEHIKDHTNVKAKEWLPKEADYASKRRKTDLASLPFQTPHELKNLIEQPVLARIKSISPFPPARPPAPGTVIENSIGTKLVLIPAGEFEMGSRDSATALSNDELPRHRVRLSRSYYLGKYEVTQREWKAVMGTEPWKGEEHVREGADYPAVSISHGDAEEFCRRLSALPAERAAGRVYRLPTEAEWEHGCRGGNKEPTRYHFGDSEADLGKYAWYRLNSAFVGEEYAHHVGQKLGNGYGLYDMHGNVWEWCSDWYDVDYYGTSAASGPDPTGPSGGSLRVVRGGSWYELELCCRVAHRDRCFPTSRGSQGGFRLALSFV